MSDPTKSDQKHDDPKTHHETSNETSLTPPPRRRRGKNLKIFKDQSNPRIWSDVHHHIIIYLFEDGTSDIHFIDKDDVRIGYVVENLPVAKYIKVIKSSEEYDTKGSLAYVTLKVDENFMKTPVNQMNENESMALFVTCFGIMMKDVQWLIKCEEQRNENDFWSSLGYKDGINW